MEISFCLLLKLCHLVQITSSNVIYNRYILTNKRHPPNLYLWLFDCDVIQSFRNRILLNKLIKRTVASIFCENSEQFDIFVKIWYTFTMWWSIIVSTHTNKFLTVLQKSSGHMSWSSVNCHRFLNVINPVGVMLQLREA
jgi:hypothetical protein